MEKRSSLGMSPQETSKKYKRQSLGMPLRHPFFIRKNQVTFQDTIFLLLHALCIFLGASVVFVFSFLLMLTGALVVDFHFIGSPSPRVFTKNRFPQFSPIHKLGEFQQ
jgi:hypothetical protein